MLQNKITKGDKEIVAAVNTHNFAPFTPWENSTGLKTAPLNYNKFISRYSVAETFILNTRNIRSNADNTYSILSYLNDNGMVSISLNRKENVSKSALIQLPENVPLDLSLGQTLINRRSIRNYTGDPLSFNYLATLIRSAMGISTNATVKLSSQKTVTFAFSTAPSAGGLYPIELYFVAVNIKGLKQGFYRYLPLTDAIQEIQSEKIVDKILKVFVIPEDNINSKYANIIFFMIANPWKTMRKYGDRGLRFVFHEIGSISQNIHLAATALGIGSVDCASFCEDEIHQVLTMDETYKNVMHSIFIGIPG